MHAIELHEIENTEKERLYRVNKNEKRNCMQCIHSMKMVMDSKEMSQTRRA